MTASKDTASFFENGTTEQFEFCYKLYPQVLRLKAEKRNKKPQELIRLDEWYQNELPKLIKARGKDAHMIYDELVQTMKWKQSRGKFYPQLSYLVKVNTPRAVMQETKKAFRKLPNLEQAITALSNLKGVGTTMASALLAAAAPDSAPFMADECLMAIPEIEGIDYTTKEYLNFVNHIQATVERLNTEVGGETPFWSPHRVELALWAHYVANDLSPELLEEMPGPGAGGGANTNGSAVKAAKVLDGNEEDTNDGDDESLGAAIRGEPNNTATESETENENTNPLPTVAVATNAAVAGSVLQQDGDSNFVSNDSTSQEPQIDDNTTQTTATTSTDDGEAGTTPLASDSESNLEAPSKPNNSSNSNNSSQKSALSNNCTQHKSSSNIKSTNNSPQKTSNGNGTLAAVAAATAAVISDGENSSCVRSSTGNEEDYEEDEEEDELLDESSNNSNSRQGEQQQRSHHKAVNEGIKKVTAERDSNNDSTLSSAASAQKRSALQQCGNEVGEVEEPEMKKLRSD